MNYVPPQPYVAPWQTEFNRYSTNLFTIPLANPVDAHILVASGQFWKLVNISAVYDFSSDVADRLMRLEITNQQNQILYRNVQPGVGVADAVVNAVWTPEAVSYSQTDMVGHGYTIAPMPNVVWSPGTKIFIGVINNMTTDAIIASPTMLVEVYTEDYNAATPGTLVPTPQIT